MKRSILKMHDEGDQMSTRFEQPGKKEDSFRSWMPRPTMFGLLVTLCIFSFCLFCIYLNFYLPTNHNQIVYSNANKNNEFTSEKEGNREEKEAEKQKKTDEVFVPNTDKQSLEDYNVLLQLVNAHESSKFAKNFYNCIKSILSRTQLDLKFHLTVDSPSIETAENILERIKNELNLTKTPEVSFYMVDELNNHTYPYTKALQELFSSGPNTYYSHSIFFISAALHKIFPLNIKKLVMLDTDLQFRTDIKNLFDLFSEMAPSNIMALAREQQPVYRHVLWNYRNKNPGTKVGEPPPDGLAGFNSGVKLMNLEEMRNSDIYNGFLDRKNVIKVADKYSFRGHLGDQDFFSLVSFEEPSLFYTLPCQWNRQLCTYWKDNGYKDVFDDYFNCKRPFYVIHGNCNTPIPD